ncbi:cytochrome ubiquinol oxidase subunit I [Petrimonas sp.]|uniref:cytochrome ubiquinol oxidase subunit I n=1 Tax=Petrimonas sp. TaxID=2023866 RepID=UPI003F514E14
MELLAITSVDMARTQFALTAMYHWIFVPLTLGLGVIMAIMETIYVRTGDEKWKYTAKFWQKLFGINFAIGVATGIIMEFQFGTNWSNYSLFVGDIFGAPLAIEGILAFFMEATFISIMFFGWNRVSKGAHLASTWLTITGATLSAYWILVANAWMQYPAGMEFNLDTMRNEMTDFWAVALSPVAVNKFFHTVTSSWGVGASFVVGVGCWYLIRKRNIDFALRSIKVGAIFGLVGFLLTAYTGDGSAYEVTQKQPMKLAAMEGLYEGKEGAGLIAVGLLNPNKKSFNDDVNPHLFKLEIPKLLSLMGYRNANAFVPGIKDVVEGGYTLPDGTTALSFSEMRERGKIAHQALADYGVAKQEGRDTDAANYEAIVKDNFKYFGYAFLDAEEDMVPPVGVTFYSFHLMVMIGLYFILFFAVIIFFHRKKKLHKTTWLQHVGLWSIALAYLATQLGWLVAEFGRQPWTIQDILPVSAAVSGVSAGNILATIVIFMLIFTGLLIANVTILTKQIKKGPDPLASESH